MYFEEFMRVNLNECGLFPNQVDEVMELVKTDEDLGLMRQRWHDSTDGYPEGFVNSIWNHVRRVTLKYIEANCPLAWFKPMFTDADIEKTS